VHGYALPAESDRHAPLDLLGMDRLRRFIRGGAHRRRRYRFQGVARRDGAAPGIFHSELWGFAPAVLVVAATIILLLREFVFSNNKLHQQAISKAAAETSSLPPLLQKPSAIPAATSTDAKPKKVFVNVSPSYLIGLYENRTTILGDDLAAAYIGKWMIVTSKVQDIRLTEDGTFHALILDSDGAWTSADFMEKSSDTISHIAHNSIIKVHGEISSANPYVVLRKCELDEIP
jgi:hypothetical protein